MPSAFPFLSNSFIMSTEDSDTASLDPTQQTDPSDGMCGSDFTTENPRAPNLLRTRVFEVRDQEGSVYAVKNCRVENHPKGQMEHDIVARPRNDMDDEEFHRYFIGISGHRKTGALGWFDGVWKTLKSGALELGGGTLKQTHASSFKDYITDQDHVFLV